jgi:16S rRNA (cytosine1402-N4)-methyltransferase
VIEKKPIQEQPTIFCILSNFRDIKKVVENIASYTSINQNSALHTVSNLTCVYADLGVSSVHFDTAERGFSFRFDGPLDMRLDLDSPITAKSLLNSLEYDKMAEMFRIYGDEPKAGYLTKKILEARKIKPIETTKELSDIITKVSRDSLARVFQALRIAVNDEYGALRTMLTDAHDILTPSGVLSMIAFHSGEDRIVKHFFREKSTPEKDPITGQDTTP